MTEREIVQAVKDGLTKRFPTATIEPKLAADKSEIYEIIAFNLPSEAWFDLATAFVELAEDERIGPFIGGARLLYFTPEETARMRPDLAPQSFEFEWHPNSSEKSAGWSPLTQVDAVDAVKASLFISIEDWGQLAYVVKPAAPVLFEDASPSWNMPSDAPCGAKRGAAELGWAA